MLAASPCDAIVCVQKDHLKVIVSERSTMGICMSVKRLTDTSRERILANPSEISLCFDLTDEDSGESSLTPNTERDPCFDEPECDLDKSWDVLCFLFCGATYGTIPDENSFPSSFLYPESFPNSWVNLPDLFGLGPPWIYSSQEVKEIARFLNAQTEEQLRAKFTPAALMEAEAYPSVWDQYENNSSPEWEEVWLSFCGSLSELREFVQEASERNLALMFYLA